MQIILTAPEKELADAWKHYCGDLENVTIYHGSILDLECDAIVSPANSFGFMDGGIDQIYSEHFGWHVQERLQTAIQKNHQGELLVGMAEIVPTGNKRVPYLIAAPTMRVPMILENSVNPYLAARAVLLLIKNGSFSDGALKGQPIAQAVRSVAFPGLGTGVGRVEPNICAKQMRKAIEDVVFENYEFPKSWVEVTKRHHELYTNRIQDLQQE